ncbi:hypothetical protein TWF694_002604 [Orbilia ellipsospora]|uniref:CHAT domain-containing protein n=1 Tax=Orbilia ellipsospora TaxID=2528407 RepID=A0AAV9X2H1_9PEZI
MSIFSEEIVPTAILASTQGDSSKLRFGILLARNAIYYAYSIGEYSLEAVLGLLLMLERQVLSSADLTNLEFGIQNGHRALRIIPPEHDARPEIYQKLGLLYVKKYKSQSNISDLEAAIENYKNSLSATSSQGHTAFSVSVLVHLSMALHVWFDLTSDLEYIDQLVGDLEAALESDSNIIDEYRFNIVFQLSDCFGIRFRSFRKNEDLFKALDLAKEAIILAKDNALLRAIALDNLATWLFLRYERDREIADRDHAIELQEEARSLLPDDPQISHNLAILLKTRYYDETRSDDIDASIKAFEKAFEIYDPRDPEYSRIAYDYAEVLGHKLERTGDPEDAKLALAMCAKALESNTQFNSGRAIAIQSCRFFNDENMRNPILANDLENLNGVIEALEQLLTKCSPSHRDRHLWLEGYANSLGARFLKTEDINDINEAIRLTEEAIVSDKGFKSPRKILSHGEWLGIRFLRLGNMDNLNQAIKKTAEALEAAKGSFRQEIRCQAHLGRWLALRSALTGDLRDLDSAIAALAYVVSAIPNKHILQRLYVNELSSMYFARGAWAKDKSSITRSIDSLQTFIDGLPDNELSDPIFFSSIATKLFTRAIGYPIFSESHKLDVEKSIEYFDKAFQLIGVPEFEDFDGLGHFAASLRHRFLYLSRQQNDIDRSIQLLQDARARIPAKHRVRGYILLQLGYSLGARFRYGGKVLAGDEAEELKCYIEAFHSRGSAPSMRIQGAMAAATILEPSSGSSEAAKILEDAIDLLPTIAARSLSPSDQQNVLGAISGLSTNAAILAIQAGYDHYKAITLLERGRGIIAEILTESRMDMLDMSMLEPGAAVEYQEARKKLNVLQIASAQQSLDDRFAQTYIVESEERRKAEAELLEVIKKIQTDPKTQGFLQPPTLGQVMEVLGDDTIVIIVATWNRSKAFLITKLLGVSLVDLPNLNFKDLRKWDEYHKISRPLIDPSMLEWLWDVIAGPILKHIRFDPTKALPRVIWMPTGSLTRLPIHAAGKHASGSTETVIDRVISSYTSSLRSFVRARKMKSISMRTSRDPSKIKALLVAMPKTASGGKWLPNLPFATEEINVLKKLCPRLGAEPVTLGNQSCKAVLEHLDATILHFAGHGENNPTDPSKSGLWLENGLLTVSDLRARDLGERKPFIGYLSACLTGTCDADNLIDEGIHTANALQLAGFRHVVGTLWQVYDRTCVKIARTFYEYMANNDMSDESVCAALHKATIEQRDFWLSTRPSVTVTRSTLKQRTYNTSETDSDNALDKGSDTKGLSVGGKERGEDGADEWRWDKSIYESKFLLDIQALRQDVRYGDLDPEDSDTLVGGLIRADWVPYMHFGP